MGRSAVKLIDRLTSIFFLLARPRKLWVLRENVNMFTFLDHRMKPSRDWDPTVIKGVSMNFPTSLLPR